MKCFTHLYEDQVSFAAFAKSLQLQGKNNVMVQVFTNVMSFDFIDSLRRNIISAIPQAVIIGCTDGGGIMDGNMFDSSTVMMIMVFEHTKLKTGIACGEDPFQAGQKLSDDLVAPDTRLLVAFTTGYCDSNWMVPDFYLEGFDTLTKKIPLAGGVAGDNTQFDQSYIFNEERVSKCGIVGASFSGDHLEVLTTLNLGWRPIGMKMQVTKSSGNRILELDGKPAAKVMLHYFGGYAEHGNTRGFTLPLYTVRDNVRIARGVHSINNDGSITMGASFRENEYVRFSYGDSKILSESSRKMAPEWNVHDIDAILMYSCILRKLNMPTAARNEVELLGTHVPCIGFYTNGEFFYTGKHIECLNCTQTITGLKEHDKPVKNHLLLLMENVTSDPLLESDQISYEDYETRTTLMLHHLVNVMTGDLIELNHELERKNEELSKTLEEIRTIRGLLPICAACKKVRDDSGYWQQVEVYIKDHTQAVCSHALCPECAKKLYPEAYQEMLKDKNIDTDNKTSHQE